MVDKVFTISEIHRGGAVGRTVISGWRGEEIVIRLTREMDEEPNNLHWVVHCGTEIWSRKKDPA